MPHFLRIAALVFMFASMFIGTTTASASTPISTLIITDTTWTKANSPYIISYAEIALGVTLTIEPGTIIKVQPNTNAFIVNGTLAIGSTGGEQVTITSVNDDSVGGDTNGNGTTTIPNAGDWRTMVLNPGAVVHMENTAIKYGGTTVHTSASSFPFPLIQNKGGMLTLDHVTIAQGQSNGIQQLSGTTTITNSTITDCPRGIQNEGGRLELANNTFTNMSDYSVIVYGTSDFVNHGGNHGNRGMYMAYTMTGAQVWVKDNIPYLLPGMNIPSGTTLTIAPGALMKVLNAANPFFIDGTLIIGSITLPEQVFITSATDDAVGGDTNGDASTTIPVAGDWRTIRINGGGVMHMENTTISYGGALVHTSASSFSLPLIQNMGGTLTLNNVTLSESQNDGITQTGGTLTVASSTFTHLGGSGIFTAGLGNILTVSTSTFDTVARGVYVSDGTTFTTGGNTFIHLSTSEALRVDSSWRSAAVWCRPPMPRSAWRRSTPTAA
jgi:hypothetical protein